MCLSMYDRPDSLRRFLDEATDTFIAIWRALDARIPRVEGGAVSPFGIWAPGSVVRTQCDASAFLSPRQYQRWYLPCDVRIAEAADYSFIHLHSCSLHVVDAILEVEKPRAIQITLESRPKGPSLETMLPILRRILAVKPLLMEGPLTDGEVTWLRERLPAGGLAITARDSEW
jgi:5-methyltetrahydrofolate--homocysteine methyltransferase